MRHLLPSAFVIASICVAPAARAQCAAPSCDPPPLALANAAIRGVPLIWSPSEGRLVPAFRYGQPVVLGREVPIGVVIGRHISPIGPPARELIYNMPDSIPGLVEPGVSLMPVGGRRQVGASR